MRALFSHLGQSEQPAASRFIVTDGYNMLNLNLQVIYAPRCPCIACMHVRSLCCWSRSVDDRLCSVGPSLVFLFRLVIQYQGKLRQVTRDIGTTAAASRFYLLMIRGG